ncbi:multiple myeloma tumor-associated protein 2 homolog [Zophobas morio]|uniref:multiple myeloma tumor-associated protein 2 homolog n=1 Tax=Zophobas morio TaxID=2755281 RepID=UPI003082DF99
MFSGLRKGGIRGGQDQFDWNDVKQDKFRENYLGNSLMAPVGRWQKGRDLNWYTKKKQSKPAHNISTVLTAEEDERRKHEIALIKQQETRFTAAMLAGEPIKHRFVELSRDEKEEILKRGHCGEVIAGERVEGIGFSKSANYKRRRENTGDSLFIKTPEEMINKSLEENKKETEEEKPLKVKKAKKKKKKEKKSKKRNFGGLTNNTSQPSSNNCQAYEAGNNTIVVIPTGPVSLICAIV